MYGTLKLGILFILTRLMFYFFVKGQLRVLLKNVGISDLIRNIGEDDVDHKRNYI